MFTKKKHFQNLFLFTRLTKVSYLKLMNFYQLTLRITGFLYVVHHPVFQKTREHNLSEAGSVSILR
jgi:hypothetical protein